jgi:hypothetical protein
MPTIIVWVYFIFQLAQYRLAIIRKIYAIQFKINGYMTIDRDLITFSTWARDTIISIGILAQELVVALFGNNLKIIYL